jgi:hypothetical protein
MSLASPLDTSPYFLMWALSSRYRPLITSQLHCDYTHCVMKQPCPSWHVITSSPSSRLPKAQSFLSSRKSLEHPRSQHYALPLTTSFSAMSTSLDLLFVETPSFNICPPSKLQRHYRASLLRPMSVNALLTSHGFPPSWKAPPRLPFPQLMYRMPACVSHHGVCTRLPHAVYSPR